MNPSLKGLWRRYKEEYRKQNSLPLPVWRFWLALFLLFIMFAVSLALIIDGQIATGAVFLPLVLVIAFMAYAKRPEKYKGTFWYFRFIFLFSRSFFTAGSYNTFF